MLLGLISSIRMYWKMAVAVAVAAIPIVTYVIGRNHAAANAQKNRLKEKLQAERDRADFYKRLKDETEHSKSSAPRSHDDWLKRMRNNGF